MIPENTNMYEVGKEGESEEGKQGCSVVLVTQKRKKWTKTINSEFAWHPWVYLSTELKILFWKCLRNLIISQLDKSLAFFLNYSHTCTLVALKLLGIAWWSSSRKLYLFWSWMLQVTYWWAMGGELNKDKNTAQWDGDGCKDSLNETIL